MKEIQRYFDVIKRCLLFDKMEDGELRSLLSCLSAVAQSLEKGAFVFLTGDMVRHVGIVLAGVVHIVQEDVWGNRTILLHRGPGGLFAEAISCSEIQHAPVSAMAAEKSVVLLIDYRRIIHTCSPACTYHSRLLTNMLGILARNNIALTYKVEHMSRKTTRDKLLSYLSAQALDQGSSAFSIPFNRQELAEYLAVDRSAMSAELGRMRDDGLLRFEKNQFELLTSARRQDALRQPL